MAARTDLYGPDLATLSFGSGCCRAMELRSITVNRKSCGRVLLRSGKANPKQIETGVSAARANRGVARAYRGEMNNAIDDADQSLKELESGGGLEPSARAVLLNNTAVVYLMARRFDRQRSAFSDEHWRSWIEHRFIAHLRFLQTMRTCYETPAGAGRRRQLSSARSNSLLREAVRLSDKLSM